MNWICVLEQAVAGTLCVFLVVASIYGTFKFGFWAKGAYDRSEYAQRRAIRLANAPPPRPSAPAGPVRQFIGNAVKWIWIAWIVSVALFCLYIGGLIPLGKSILNVAMGRECW